MMVDKIEPSCSENLGGSNSRCCQNGQDRSLMTTWCCLEMTDLEEMFEEPLGQPLDWTLGLSYLLENPALCRDVSFPYDVCERLYEAREDSQKLVVEQVEITLVGEKHRDVTVRRRADIHDTVARRGV